jgi:hypothetical protein
MSQDKKTLDLDELFGQARAVKVKWQGREYELLRMEGISPKQAVYFQKLQLRASKLQSNTEAVDDESAEEIETLFDDMLKILCADLPLQDMQFVHKMRVLTFYIEETQGKKALETALSQAIGEKSSAA